MKPYCGDGDLNIHPKQNIIASAEHVRLIQY